LEQIYKWEKDEKARAIYWLRGPPGSGKSTIAVALAGHSANEGRLGGSFFCSRDFQDRSNIRLIFPTLSYQLAHHLPEFKAALIPVIRENPDVYNDSLDRQFYNLIVHPLQLAKIHTAIIIAALDECEYHLPTSAILSLLSRYIDALRLVKFFITSGPEPPIRSGFFLPLLQPQAEVFLLHEVEQKSEDIELYLRTRLSRIVPKRSPCNLTVPWPGDEEIKLMIEICSGLFIVASIIVKYVSSRFYDPEERLKKITSNLLNSVLEGESVLDRTYDIVLIEGFKIGINETDVHVDLQLVVGSIVVVFDPLSCASLAAILGIEKSRVRTVLGPLHSIFTIPDTESEPIRNRHPSLADYLQDKNRCKDTRFYINPLDLHFELGLRCLRLMNNSLKKNICKLPRYTMNAEIDDLDERRMEYIGDGLEYGCKWWAKHLRLASRDGENVKRVIESLEDFFEHHLLQWLEVLSIVGDLRCAVYSLHDVTSWLVDVSVSSFFFCLDVH
jgi:NACHT domain